MNREIDEVALNTLLAEGLDLPTALAASLRDDPPRPQPKGSAGCAIAVAVVAFGVLLWWMLT